MVSWSTFKRWICFSDGDPEEDMLNIKNYTPLLNWRLVNEKMAWGVLLLMGGGFAIADACSVCIITDDWIGGCGRCENENVMKLCNIVTTHRMMHENRLAWEGYDNRWTVSTARVQCAFWKFEATEGSTLHPILQSSVDSGYCLIRSLRFTMCSGISRYMPIVHLF